MVKRNFDVTGHPCESTNLSEDIWFYTQKGGITICASYTGNPTEVVVMPWRLVKRALADHEKAKSRRGNTDGSE